MGQSIAERVASLPAHTRQLWLAQQSDTILEEIARGEWWWLGRPEQIPPPGDWFVFLACAGRGFGKTRAGSEWLVERVIQYPTDVHGVPTEWLVIAETLGDAKSICMEGPAGILRVLERRRIQHRYLQSPRPRVIFPDGAKIYCEGADDEDVGRGYNAAGAWLDEAAKWAKPYESWYQGIMPSLRADLPGDHPRCFVTTTPKPDKLLNDWLRRTDGTVRVVRGSTFDNSANLSAHVLKELKTRYDGTSIGRQELYGEMVETIDGALFSRADMERSRVDQMPDDPISIVVGMDPSLTGEDDEMGVVVVARTADNDLWILADRSIMATGRAAALHAWRVVAEFGADLLLYESNLGKRWMEQVLRDAYGELRDLGMFPERSTPPMKGIDTKIGKKTRAEPVAMRFEQGRAHMVGKHPILEDQCCSFFAWYGRESPDRLDGMVHACRFLMNSERGQSRITTPTAINPAYYQDLSSDQPYLSLY